MRYNGDIREIAGQVHKTAENSGWHESPTTIKDLLLNLHGEVSEAMEADKRGIHNLVKKGKLEGVVPELADVMIRILDWAQEEGEMENLIEAIWKKNEYNKTREHRHGGKAY